MIYARAFFDLQLEFAEIVSGLSGQPLADTLLDYTFYIRFASAAASIRIIRAGGNTSLVCATCATGANGPIAST